MQFRLIFFFILVSVVSAHPLTAQALKNYHNPEYHFNLSIPKNWQKNYTGHHFDPRGISEIMSFAQPVQNDEIYPRSGITIWMLPDDQYLGDFFPDTTKYNRDKQIMISQAGRCVYFRHSWHEHDHTSLVKVYTFEYRNNGKYFVVECTTDSKYDDRNGPVLLTVGKSLRFD